MIEITTEPAHRLVRIRVTGMLGTDDVAELYRREHQVIRDMGCPLGEQIVLVDLSQCPLQLQHIAAAFEKEINSETQARRLALVTSKVIRMQARRILQRPNAALFETIEEAEAWLLDEPAQAAA